ncbi:unnamed protein product [Amaranthus hypochondriacus]
MESVHSIPSISDNLISGTETWAFRSSFDNSWIAEAFARDSEILTKALQEVSYSHVLNPETPSSHNQTQSLSSSGGACASETDTVSKQTTFRNAPTVCKKITKRKSRASKRSPTTFITADPENFRQMVQQVTGIRFSPGSGQVIGSVVKPEPHRPVGVLNRLQTGCLLPTLDTSAFLLDHHQQVVGSGLGSGSVNAGLGPGSVVAQAGGSGFDFDGFSGFPTLESWN